MDWFNANVLVKRRTLMVLLILDIAFLATNVVKAVNWVKTLPEKIQERRIERKYSSMTKNSDLLQ